MRTFAPRRHDRHGPVSPKADAVIWPDRPTKPQSLFRDVLAAGGRLDVVMADDDAQAKASVSAFIKSLGLRPQDTCDLSMAH
jgi:hypothetical protein